MPSPAASIIKKPRSVKLTSQEKSWMKKYRKQFKTEVECAVSIGLDRGPYNRIMKLGSGSGENVAKIREAIKGSNLSG